MLGPVDDAASKSVQFDPTKVWPKRQKKLRGQEAARRKTISEAEKQRAARFMARLDCCWVCGKQVNVKPGEPLPEGYGYRKVSAWTILACDSHAKIGTALTLNKGVRFFEVPSVS